MNDLTRFNKLTDPAKRGKYQFESVAKTKGEIDSILKVYTVMTAVTAFSVGERLAILKEQLGHGKFMKYVEKEFSFSYSTATRYMRLFERYKDNPAEMEKFGLTEALMNAGIIKPKESIIEPLLPIEPLPPYHQLEFDYDFIFKQKPLNMDVRQLKNFRFAVMDDEIALFEKGVKGYRAAANLSVFGKNDPRMKKFYIKAAEKIQMALEEYYQFYEFTLLEDIEKTKHLK
jgi:hypothetical protein